jgi:hypothetical protein
MMENVAPLGLFALRMRLIYQTIAPLGLCARIVQLSYQTIAPPGLENARGISVSDLRAQPHRGGILFCL